MAEDCRNNKQRVEERERVARRLVVMYYLCARNATFCHAEHAACDVSFVDGWLNFMMAVLCIRLIRDQVEKLASVVQRADSAAAGTWDRRVW